MTAITMTYIEAGKVADQFGWEALDSHSFGTSCSCCGHRVVMLRAEPASGTRVYMFTFPGEAALKEALLQEVEA
ncbi:MAG: hypothetical protein AAF628_08310 [Planctomycetota bacterium]